MEEESAKDYTILEFLENTSLSTTPRSPTITSTAIKDLLKLRNENALIRKQDLSELLQSLFTASQVESVSELHHEPENDKVTSKTSGVCNESSPLGLEKVRDGASSDGGSSSTLTPSDENSSLGILTLDGMSDFSESVTRLTATGTESHSFDFMANNKNFTQEQPAYHARDLDKGSTLEFPVSRTLPHETLQINGINTLSEKEKLLKTNDTSESYKPFRKDESQTSRPFNSTNDHQNRNEEPGAGFSDTSELGDEEYKQIKGCRRKTSLSTRYFVPTRMTDNSDAHVSFDINLEKHPANPDIRPLQQISDKTSISKLSEDKKIYGPEMSFKSTRSSLAQNVNNSSENSKSKNGSVSNDTKGKLEEKLLKMNELHNTGPKENPKDTMPDHLSSSSYILNHLLQSDIAMNSTNLSTPSKSPLDASSFNVENLFYGSAPSDSELKKECGGFRKQKSLPLDVSSFNVEKLYCGTKSIPPGAKTDEKKGRKATLNDSEVDFQDDQISARSSSASSYGTSQSSSNSALSQQTVKERSGTNLKNSKSSSHTFSEGYSTSNASKGCEEEKQFILPSIGMPSRRRAYGSDMFLACSSLGSFGTRNEQINIQSNSAASCQETTDSQMCGDGQPVVYTTPEGEYVTKLAFQTNLAEEGPPEFIMEANDPVSNKKWTDIGFDMGSEEFLNTSDASKMLKDDEQVFHKAHMLELPGNISIQTNNLSCISWEPPTSQNITRPSWFSDVADASDQIGHKISIGQFIRARTEALGCLDGKGSQQRPHFGIEVVTPRQSLESRISEEKTGQCPVDSISKDADKEKDLCPVTVEIMKQKRIEQEKTPTCQSSASFSNQENSSQLGISNFMNDSSESDSDSLISLSTLSRILSDTSIDDPHHLAKRFYHHIREQKYRNTKERRERPQFSINELATIREALSPNKTYPQSEQNSQNKNKENVPVNAKKFIGSAEHSLHMLKATPASSGNTQEQSVAKGRLCMRSESSQALFNSKQKLSSSSSDESLRDACSTISTDTIPPELLMNKAVQVEGNLKSQSEQEIAEYRLNDPQNQPNKSLSVKNTISRSLSLSSLSAETDQLLSERYSPLCQSNRHLSLETLSHSSQMENVLRPLTVSVENCAQGINSNASPTGPVSSTVQHTLHSTLNSASLRCNHSAQCNCGTAINCHHCFQSSQPFPSVYVQPLSCIPQCRNGLLPQAHGVSGYWPGHIPELLQNKGPASFAATYPIYSGPTSLIGSQPVLYPSALIQCPSVQGPSEIQHPDVLCVGDLKQLSIPIHNPTSCDLHYNLQLVSVTVNDSTLPVEVSGFTFLPQVQVAGGITKQVQITFAAKQPGKVVAKLEITATFGNGKNSITTSQQSVVGCPLSVTIHLEVQAPQIAFQTNNSKNRLEFGSVPENSTATHSILLVNSCPAPVTTRVFLSEEPHSKHAFSFDIQEMRSSISAKKIDCHFLSSTMLLCRLHGHKENDDLCSQFSIPLIFHAGQLSVNHESDLEHSSSTLTAILESSVITEVLACAKLCATVGSVKFHVKPPMAEPLLMKAKYGSKMSQQVTIWNGGTLATKGELIIQGNGDYFTVCPSTIEFQPLKETEVTITFCPSQPQIYECTLEATIPNSVKTYELLKIKGEGVIFAIPLSIPNHCLLKKNVKQSEKKQPVSSLPHVESNRRFLVWGGLDLDQSKTKTVTFRNPSLNESLDVYLIIKGEYAFQLHSLLEDSLVSMLSFTLQPNKEQDIQVTFAPQETKPFHAQLYVKTEMSQAKTSGKTLRSKIPLSGYGGVSKVQIQDLPFCDGKYTLELEADIEGDATFSRFTVSNSGARAAFVKILCYADEDMQQVMSGGSITVQPSEFILMEKETKTLFVAYTTSLPVLQSNLVSILVIFYGDEILRQKLRSKKQPFIPLAPGDQLKSVNFDVTYLDEEKVVNDSSLEDSPKDSVLFYSNISRLYLHLTLPHHRHSFSRLDFTTLSLLQDSTLSSILNDTTCSTTRSQTSSPPVKEMPSTKSSFIIDNSVSTISTTYYSEDLSSTLIDKEESIVSLLNTSTSEKSFKIEPEELVFPAKKLSNKLLLTNLGAQELHFSVKDSNSFSISPDNDIISPRSSVTLQIDLKPPARSNVNEKSESITMILGKTEVVIPVKIGCLHLPTPMKSTLHNSLLSKGENLDLSALCDEPTEISTERQRMKFENLLNFPKMLKLDGTKAGAHSETTFQIFNPTSSCIRWTVIPSQPPYLQKKEYDEKKQVSSTVISLNPGNGLIKPKEHATITAYFGPKEQGNFTQLWEVCMGYDDGIKCISSIHIEGSGDAPRPSLPSGINISGGIKIAPPTSNAIVKTTKEIPRLPFGGSKDVRVTTKKPIHATADYIKFPSTECGKTSVLRIRLKNTTRSSHLLTVLEPSAPFMVKHSDVNIKSKYYINMPVYFCPTKAGFYKDMLTIQTNLGYDIKVTLTGNAVSIT